MKRTRRKEIWRWRSMEEDAGEGNNEVEEDVVRREEDEEGRGRGRRR